MPHRSIPGLDSNIGTFLSSHILPAVLVQGRHVSAVHVVADCRLLDPRQRRSRFPQLVWAAPPVAKHALLIRKAQKMQVA